MLYGIVFLSHQVGSFLGAWLGGLLYDLQGSYDLMWWLTIASGFVATILHLLIKEVPARRMAAAAE
jgi:predicted MFS family arabinose efflux permease